MARKVKKRLRKPYKILLGILAVLVIVAGFKLLGSIEPEGPEYGDISDQVDVTEDENAADAISEPEQGNDFDLETAPFTVELLDVGQGQSVFIDYGEMEVLIDAGYPEYGQSVCEKIRDRVDGKLDYVIATHSDLDHIGGLSEVYKVYDVEHTIYGDLTDEAACQIFEKDARAGSESFENDSNTTIDLGKNGSLTIFDPTDKAADTNDNSVICLIQYGDTYFFCSGDAGESTEKMLRGKLPECDVVIAGHHGSSTSNSLLDILQPEYFLISAGVNNEYGHPHKEVLTYATNQGASVYGTWKSGDITCTSDGMSVFIDTKGGDELTADDAGAPGRKSS